MSTIYLIRHGETAQAKPRRFLGRQDPPLTAHGRAQMARLAEFLAIRAIDRVVTSPLARCVDSAAILCATLQLEEAELVPSLREIDLGAWEGLTVAEVQTRFPGEYEARGRDLAGYRPAGGESFCDLLYRAWPALSIISAAGEDRRLAVVAHAGVNRVLLCRLLGMPLDRLFLLEQHHACLNVLHHRQEGFRVERINWCP